MSFLNAEWRKLILINYEVEEAILKDYLPYQTELDSWNGVHYLSLVGFMFVNTKVLGLKIPFHTNFEEVNLRFYVRHKDGDQWKRGVVFIQEIVPRAAISFIANTLYKEHYVTRKMRHQWHLAQGQRLVQYEWQHANQWQSIQVKAEELARPIPEGSELEFITEHYWGYTKINDHTTYEYEVRHPRWEAYPVIDYDVQLDFAKVYGSNFGFLGDQKPKSVMLAEGSTISVENKRKI